MTTYHFLFDADMPSGEINIIKENEATVTVIHNASIQQITKEAPKILVLVGDIQFQLLQYSSFGYLITDSIAKKMISTITAKLQKVY